MTLHYATTTTTTTLPYARLHYTIPHYATLHDITVHYTTLLHHTTTTTANALANSLITLHLQLHYTTLQLQLHLRTTTTALHHATSRSCGEVTTATIAATPENTTPTTFRSIALPSASHNNQPLL